MRSPSVVVVVPCRDDAAFLRRCLDALAAGSTLPNRVIVVDNDSSDDTAAVARSRGATVVTQRVHGIWPAASAGYDAASEDVIVRLDADSIPPTDWLARVREHFTVAEPPDFLTGRSRFYGPRPLVNSLGDHWYIGGMYTWVSPYLGHPPLYGSCFAMRREAWRQVRGRVHSANPTVHDDLDLSFQVRPWMRVVRDDSWTVGVSARPFDSWSSLGRRLHWVVTTLRACWPESRPLRHRWERRDWSRRHPTSPPAGRGPET